MRNITLILLSVFLLVAANSCKKVEGTGSIQTENRSIADFEKVRSDISGEVYINQGYTFNVSVEAEENILPLVETILSDNRLTIRYKQHIVLKPNQTIKVRVTMPVIFEIMQKGSGRIECDEFVEEGHDLHIDMSGSGSINLSKLTAQTINTTINGSGNVAVNDGRVVNSTLNVNGSGNINQTNLRSSSAEVNIKGSGNVRLNVTDFLKVVITGSGDVHYTGNPEIDAWVTGSGRLKKM